MTRKKKKNLNSNENSNGLDEVSNQTKDVITENAINQKKILKKSPQSDSAIVTNIGLPPPPSFKPPPPPKKYSTINASFFADHPPPQNQPPPPPKSMHPTSSTGNMSLIPPPPPTPPPPPRRSNSLHIHKQDEKNTIYKSVEAPKVVEDLDTVITFPILGNEEQGTGGMYQSNEQFYMSQFAKSSPNLLKPMSLEEEEEKAAASKLIQSQQVAPKKKTTASTPRPTNTQNSSFEKSRKDLAKQRQSQKEKLEKLLGRDKADALLKRIHEDSVRLHLSMMSSKRFAALRKSNESVKSTDITADDDSGEWRKLPETLSDEELASAVDELKRKIAIVQGQNKKLIQENAELDDRLMRSQSNLTVLRMKLEGDDF